MTRRADIPRLRIGRPSCESTGSRGRALRSCAWASARWPDLNSPRSSGVARLCGDAMARTSERYGPRPANKELRNRRETAQDPVTQGCDPVATNAHDRGILSSTCGRSNARLIGSSTLRTLRIISSKGRLRFVGPTETTRWPVGQAPNRRLMWAQGSSRKVVPTNRRVTLNSF